MKKISLIILFVGLLFSACKNGNMDFPDYDYSAVYFAYQSPVRTIELGTDYVNDNTLDNQRQCQIMATVGGLREVKQDIEVDFKIDNTLCDNLDNVVPMPSNYYTLSDNKMIIKKGSKMMGGVVVQLTDAFFADPLSLTTHYVIPLVMTDVKNADKILTGTAVDGVDNPNRYNINDWTATPKDYILYAIKYLNPYDANYLRRGTDNITIDGVASTETRKGPYATPEGDELIRLSSISMNSIDFPVTNQKVNNVNLNMTFRLDFDPATQKCTFANGAWIDNQLVNEYTFVYAEQVDDKTKIHTQKSYRVYDIAVSGTGEYVKNGEKNSWGNKDRDALYLTYKDDYMVDDKVRVGTEDPNDPNTITWGEWVVNQTYAIKYETNDVLVLRDRNIAVETFTPELVP